jgi:hypothetical protein
MTQQRHTRRLAAANAIAARQATLFSEAALLCPEQPRYPSVGRPVAAVATMERQATLFPPIVEPFEGGRTRSPVATEQTYPKSRAAAKAAGIPLYWTGRPCLRGHVAPRRASKGNCIVCQYAWAVRWRADNPERSRATVQRWRDANRDKSRSLSRASRKREYERDPEGVREKNRRWRLENREEWLRVLSAAGRKWRQKNPAKELHRVRMRQVAKLKATPH